MCYNFKGHKSQTGKQFYGLRKSVPWLIPQERGGWLASRDPPPPSGHRGRNTGFLTPSWGPGHAPPATSCARTWCVQTLCPRPGQLEVSPARLQIIVLIFRFGVWYNLQKVGNYSHRPELSSTVATGHPTSAQKHKVWDGAVMGF